MFVDNNEWVICRVEHWKYFVQSNNAIKLLVQDQSSMQWPCYMKPVQDPKEVEQTDKPNKEIRKTGPWPSEGAAKRASRKRNPELQRVQIAYEYSRRV